MRRTLGLVLLLLILPSPTWAARPVLDACSSSNADAAASLTYSHTVSAGSNLYLVVGVSYYDGSSKSISGVTYNGVAMTQLGPSVDSGGFEVDLWGLANPATGAHNVVVTASGAGTYFVSGACSFSGVHQTVSTGTFASATGFSADPSVNVTSAADELVIDVVAWDKNVSTTATAGGNQTQRWQIVSGASGMAGSGSTEGGAGTVTMSWTLSLTSTWAIGGISLKPSTGGVTQSSGLLLGISP